MNPDNVTLKIGIFGGTFDPIHLGHVHAAKTVQSELGLDQMNLVPSFIPVHRDKPQATSEQRLAMIEMAVEGQLQCFVDNREIERQGDSYSLLTVKEYREQYPEANLYFILGSDAMCQFNTWYHWQEILDYVNLIVLKRPGHELVLNEELTLFFSDKTADTASDISHSSHGLMYISSEAMMLFSATEVRTALSEGQVVGNMLSENVVSYIQNHQLYENF